MPRPIDPQRLYNRFDDDLDHAMQRPIALAQFGEFMEFAVCAEVTGTVGIENEPINIDQIMALVSKPYQRGANDNSLRAAQSALRALAHVRATRPRYAMPTKPATDCGFIREIHSIALDTLVSPSVLGAWRESEIKIVMPDGSVAVQGAPPSELDQAMARWSESYDVAVYRGHRLARIADAHAEFERIRPFLEGNGRVGRLVIQAMAIESGMPFLPISKILFERQRDYFGTLSVAQRTRQLDEWRALFAELCIDALQLYPR
jgi:Fic family protein